MALRFWGGGEVDVCFHPEELPVAGEAQLWQPHIANQLLTAVEKRSPG